MLEIKNIKINHIASAEHKTLVFDASLSVERGQVVLLSGANGSGKSSLLYGIFKHPEYSIESGSMVLDGTDVTNYKTDELARAGMFLAMQHVPEIAGVKLVQFLYKAYKNIHIDNKESIIDFNKKLLGFCEQYDIDKTFLQRDLNVGFSGGEKKQVELLHLLALTPKYALLDEPDSGVDRESIEKILKVITDMSTGDAKTGFIIISHSDAIKSNLKVDQEYIMADGKLGKKI
jgi:Fe-S cluster assembly ATP-binding protein